MWPSALLRTPPQQEQSFPVFREVYLREASIRFGEDEQGRRPEVFRGGEGMGDGQAKAEQRYRPLGSLLRPGLYRITGLGVPQTSYIKSFDRVVPPRSRAVCLIASFVVASPSTCTCCMKSWGKRAVARYSPINLARFSLYSGLRTRWRRGPNVRCGLLVWGCECSRITARVYCTG